VGNALIRATIIPEVIRLICAQFGVNEDEALDMFYKSATMASLYDDETGLYGQSALYLFSEFVDELKMGNS